MAILRFAAEDLGPFRELDIDFSDGNGKPHLGPHIFAGVNGSGKSSILRGLALMSRKPHASHPNEDIDGFDFRGLLPLLRSNSKIGIEHSIAHEPTVRVFAASLGNVKRLALLTWAKQLWQFESDLHFFGDLSRSHNLQFGYGADGDDILLSVREPIVAYAPGIRLQHLRREEFHAKSLESTGDLGFEATVDNIAIQQWIVDLFSRRAIAQQSNRSSKAFEDILAGLNDSLSSIYGEGSGLEIDVEALEPRIRLFGNPLTFSQLPQGVSSTLGWIVDFARRRVRYSNSWQTQGGVLLVDEIEAYLHPRWQRRILPALRAGLPGVQIIVASHSPFVIASCANAKVHLLSLDEKTGKAKYEGASDAPIGKSVGAILRDIFGVESRFDIQTEDQLKELDDLRQKEHSGPLTAKQRARESSLVEALSNRSEELRQLVGPPESSLDVETLEARFLPTPQKPKRPRRKTAS